MKNIAVLTCLGMFLAVPMAQANERVRMSVPQEMKSQKIAQSLSYICRWQAFYCWMQAPGVVGTPCFCISHPIAGNFQGVVSFN